MPERRKAGSISRTLLLPCEYRGTFRLRHQLAEDGCKESQVVLAKSLLNSPIKTVEERNYNSQLAVYWLLQAANQGQEEAVVLLRECANVGIGINSINCLEVEKCLKFSEEDKISRRVAFSIFRAIMSDTEDIIPEEIFRERIQQILSEGNEEQPLLNFSEANIFPLEEIQHKKADDATLRNQPHVSFSEVVNSVQSCLEGNVPIVSLKQVAQYNEYKKWLSTKYFSLIGNIVLKSLEDLIQYFSFHVVLVSVLLLCISLEIALCATVPGSEINLLITKSKLLFATLLCFLAMLSSTCFIITLSFGGDNMKQWLNLIKFFEPNIKSDEIEKKFLMKATFPLLTFFLISVMYVILVPLVSLHTASSDLGILSFVLMVLVDRTISHQRYYVNISLALNLLTCLYKASFFQNLSLNALSFLNIDIAYDLGSNYKIHLSFISCLALPFVLPYLYTKMALGNERKGWHLVLLPHLMSITWINLASFHLASADNTHLVFGLFTWLMIMVFSRYAGVLITFILYLLFKTTLVAGYADFKIFLFIPAFSIFYVLSLFFVRKFKLSNEKKLWTLLLCLFILSISYLAAKPINSYAEKTSDTVVPWSKYQTFCHHPAWYRTNSADVQISCLPLKGRKISFEGTVIGIDVIKVHNSLQTVADVLPNPFRDLFMCAFGRKYATCDAVNITPYEKEHCILYETLNMTECHLHDWDEYKYQIIIEVSTRTSPEVAVVADHACSSFVRNLKEGDSLQVTGILESNIGGSVPSFLLQKAECSSCYLNKECNIFPAVLQLNYSLSLQNIVWFYLSPFIQYNLVKE